MNNQVNDYKELSAKIVRLLTPIESDIIRIFKEKVLCGKSDGAIERLVKDHGFTPEEAEWFVKKVQELHGQKIFEK